jgi:hypothetical protein
VTRPFATENDPCRYSTFHQLNCFPSCSFNTLWNRAIFINASTKNNDSVVFLHELSINLLRYTEKAALRASFSWLPGDVRFHRLSLHIEAALEHCTNFPFAFGSSCFGEVGFSPGFESPPAGRVKEKNSLLGSSFLWLPDPGKVRTLLESRKYWNNTKEVLSSFLQAQLNTNEAV